ncbi:MAG TPA: large conductance mechanosensitive channel protein MscL [Candidatus Paceibacterota bacterium]|nr:large conductance mechanosensitive channel protein MscL [Candidatus Paceibacterota bacterium]
MNSVEEKFERSPAAKRIGGFFSEFWAFASKGNALQLAVAVVLGNAFGAIVNSLVNDIITPFISLGTNNVDFSHWGYTIRPAMQVGSTTQPALVVGYGHLIQVTINFLVVGLSIFIVFKLFSNMLKRVQHRQDEEQKAAPPDPISTEEKLLSEIRDLLKAQAERDTKRE